MEENAEKPKFPAKFLLGAASAAHQVEGNNFHSDWWRYEQEGKLPKSGDAADHYNRYAEDFELAKSLGLNAMRISIEWSRIEPIENQWDENAIEHYRKVLRKLKELGMVRMVTLYHFTLPQWLAEEGGFETKKAGQALARFAWFIAKNLGDEIDYWITLNEPEIYAGAGFNQGVWPPFKKTKLLFYEVLNNLAEAHRLAYKSIKEVLPNSQVGIATNKVYLEPDSNLYLDRLAVRVAKYFSNNYFLNKLKNDFDFIGLNYYFYVRIKFNLKSLFAGRFLEMAHYISNKNGPSHSDMGVRTYPEGIYSVIEDLSVYKKDIFVTENGIANAGDNMRKRFILEHLAAIKKALDNGLKVKGYFYWSLTDTYEYLDGFDRKFGLIEVDFSNQKRRVREASDVFKEIGEVSNAI